LSTPSYCSSTDTIYAECVSKLDLKRCFLRYSPAEKEKPLKLLKVRGITETYGSEDELRILRFPLHISGVFAIARSLSIPGDVHFVSPGEIRTISVDGLNMDPLWTTVGNGAVFSVKFQEIQKIRDAAAPQTADTIPAALGLGGSVVNRPLYDFGRLFIQEENQLIAWEVATVGLRGDTVFRKWSTYLCRRIPVDHLTYAVVSDDWGYPPWDRRSLSEGQGRASKSGEVV